MSPSLNAFRYVPKPLKCLPHYRRFSEHLLEGSLGTGKGLSQTSCSEERPGGKDRQCRPGPEVPSLSRSDSRSGFFHSRGHAGGSQQGYLSPGPWSFAQRALSRSRAQARRHERGISHTRKSVNIDHCEPLFQDCSHEIRAEMRLPGPSWAPSYHLQS